MIPRAGRPEKRLVSAVCAAWGALECRAMHGAGFGFRTQQVGSADLHARRAQRHRRRYAARIGDAAGGDHRHADGFGHLRQQRQSAHLSGQILRQENAAGGRRPPRPAQ